MEKSMAVGLMLVALCVITGEFACNGSGIDPQALFDLGNDLTHPETNLSYGSSKRSNCSQQQGIVCNNDNGVLLMIHIPDLGPLNSESSSRYGFWNLIGDSPSLLKLNYLDSFKRLDFIEFLHQVLAIFLACSFMMSI
ncbi:hypothetical protein ERO13_D03G052925v2 [Gossypium hirsutum]|uniref:Leucine-rich repeat-containing N-terminal plant-type domain-containing protein n=1 Tax=Gossypium mustelinum TaxID=34275 RepID=A0A5D2VJ07_GOSMU|nr:hypothetical protein ERO13_D03G052925v2 [Gossypium hirsutum]TYI89463.1 hypothetical protein E1A91_D03G057900v1 [Gossypium mustelinum]